MWVDRKNGGEALVEAVAAASFEASDHFGWVACDNRTTRAVAKVFREEYKISKKSIEAQAYWVACRLGRDDRYDELLEHRPLVGLVMPGEQHQRGHHPHQPPGSVRDATPGRRDPARSRTPRSAP